MSQPLVLVTGSNGFLGRHTIDALLRDGACRVRAAVRQRATAQCLQETFGDIDVVECGDLLRNPDFDKLCAAMRGATAVVHVANVDWARRNEPDATREALNAARVFFDALVESKVSRLLWTSSDQCVHACSSPGAVVSRANRAFDESDWPVESALTTDAYVKSKVDLERAVFEWAARSSSPLQVVSILPGFCIGPLARGQRAPSSTLRFVVDSVCSAGESEWLANTHVFVTDVRDVADVCVAVLGRASVENESEKEQRVLVSASEAMSLRNLVMLLRGERIVLDTNEWTVNTERAKVLLDRASLRLLDDTLQATKDVCVCMSNQ